MGACRNIRVGRIRSRSVHAGIGRRIAYSARNGECHGWTRRQVASATAGMETGARGGVLPCPYWDSFPTQFEFTERKLDVVRYGEHANLQCAIRRSGPFLLLIKQKSFSLRLWFIAHHRKASH